MESDGGPRVYAAVDKRGHHRTVQDLERREEPEPPAVGASASEVMRQRLATVAGRTLYRLRHQTVEPVFGIIKEAIGFRRFSLRGLAQAGLEWTLVCLAYNLRRLHRMQMAANCERGVGCVSAEAIVEDGAQVFFPRLTATERQPKLALTPTGC